MYELVNDNQDLSNIDIFQKGIKRHKKEVPLSGTNVKLILKRHFQTEKILKNSKKSPAPKNLFTASGNKALNEIKRKDRELHPRFIYGRFTSLKT